MGPWANTTLSTKQKQITYPQCRQRLEHDRDTVTGNVYLFILFNRQRTWRSLTYHTAMSQCLTQKEPVTYTNKLIKNTADTNLQRILAVWACSSCDVLVDRKTDRQTDRHAHHDTPLPYRGTACKLLTSVVFTRLRLCFVRVTWSTLSPSRRLWTIE